MKAAQITEYGDPSVIHINEVDRPTANEGQIVVEVHASSLNPIDTAIRAGYVQQMMPLHFPATLGGDIAGIVVQVGAGVTSVTIGDTVYGQANAAFGNSGALAQYAATAASQVAKAPAGIDFKAAASLPLVGVSALQGLTQHIKLAAGQKIFITGGSGGIGSIAIQIAKHLGAYVATTATGEGLEVAQRLGADEVIDYKNAAASPDLVNYDAVFDTVGGETFELALRTLKKEGSGVTMAGQPNETLAQELGVTTMMQMTQVTAAALDQLRELVESHVIALQVGRVFTLDDVAEAFRTRENDQVVGKIVIEIK